jgi:predicted 3-demethylubiquinone-9 3-methyltransferase (glyoxalase superfamily)
MIGVTHCLWFDSQAEEAARHYVGIFGGRVGRISRYGQEGFEVHHRPAGSVMTVEFEILGQAYVALNGGPLFKFNESHSIQILCDTQDEIDRYWDLLSSGGEPGPCGWLKDRFGLSWQVVPRALADMLADPDPARVRRVTKAFLAMKKFDLAELRRARGA